MDHQHIVVTSTQPYVFKTRGRMIAGLMIIIGLVTVIAQFATDYTQTWPNLLMNNYFFMIIALGSTFFLAVQYVAEVGWSAVIKRVLEAISRYLWVAGPIMILILFFEYYKNCFVFVCVRSKLSVWWVNPFTGFMFHD